MAEILDDILKGILLVGGSCLLIVVIVAPALILNT